MRLILILSMVFWCWEGYAVVLLKLQPSKSAAHLHVSRGESGRFIPSEKTVIRTARGKAIVVKTIAKRKSKRGSVVVVDVLQGLSRVKNQSNPVFYLNGRR